MEEGQNPSLEKNFPANYCEGVVSKFFENIQKGESFSFIGMEDNCKINVLRFISTRKDVQKQYLGKKAGDYLYILVDLDELTEPSIIGFYHLLGLSLIETLKSKKVDFSFLKNIFIDSPLILLKSLKEDLAKVVEKTDKKVVILFNDFDIASKNIDLDLITRNLIALRNTARFNLIYVFTGLRPFDLKYSFYEKIIWMLPFSKYDAQGVIERNLKRYNTNISPSQKEEIFRLSGGHAGTIKFIIQNLAGLKPKRIDRELRGLGRNGDICLQCERILKPLTDIERSKLKNRQEDLYLINSGFLVKKNQKLAIFSPTLESYLNINKKCIAPFCLDKENDEIYFYGQPLRKCLTLKELDLLKLLLASPNKIFKRDEIMEKVWQGDFPTDWAFDKLVSRLRKKLVKISPDSKHLLTVRGSGIYLG